MCSSKTPVFLPLLPATKAARSSVASPSWYPGRAGQTCPWTGPPVVQTILQPHQAPTGSEPQGRPVCRSSLGEAGTTAESEVRHGSSAYKPLSIGQQSGSTPVPGNSKEEGPRSRNVRSASASQPFHSLCSRSPKWNGRFLSRGHPTPFNLCARSSVGAQEIESVNTSSRL